MLKRSLKLMAFMLVTIGLSGNVYAQSMEELEEENEELREEVEMLNETIVELEEKIAELEEMIKSLTEEESDEDGDTEERDGYGIGDDAELDGIIIRVEDAYYTDERNSVTDTVADQVLMLEIYYENHTGDDYSPAFDFEVYTDGQKAETYPVGDIILGSVSDGRNATGKIAYAIVGEPEVIELEFSPLFNIFSTSEKVIIDVTPE